MTAYVRLAPIYNSGKRRTTGEGLSLHQDLKHHRYRMGAGIHIIEQITAIEVGRTSGASSARLTDTIRPGLRYGESGL